MRDGTHERHIAFDGDRRSASGLASREFHGMSEPLVHTQTRRNNPPRRRLVTYTRNGGRRGGGDGGRAAKLSERREKGRGAAPSVRISADRETGFPLRDQPLGCCTAECNSTSPAGCRAFCRGLYALLRNIVPAICPLNVPRDRGFAPGATGLALSFPFTARQGGGGGGGGAAGGWFHGSARAETRNRRVARENAPPPFRLVVARTLACERSRRAARRLGV